MPEIDPVPIVPVEVTVPMVVLLILPEPLSMGLPWASVSWWTLRGAAWVPMLTFVAVPWPEAVIDEPVSVLRTDMPEIDPVPIVPVEVTVPVVVLLLLPEALSMGLPWASVSSGTLSEPPWMPMLTFVAVPWPEAVIDEPVSVLPTDMPEIDPVPIVPVEVTVPMVVLLILPEPLSMGLPWASVS